MTEEGELAAAIGSVVRTYRMRAGLSMRALAARVGVSQPFLSQVESGKSTPSMASVYRLAEALGVQPGDLLPSAAPAPESAREGIRVVRAGEGRRLPVSERPDAAVGSVLALGPGHGLEFTEYRVAPGEHLEEWFASGGEAGVYLVSGNMAVEFEDVVTHRLGPGDFLTHPGDVRHRWKRVDDGPIHVLIAVAH